MELTEEVIKVKELDTSKTALIFGTFAGFMHLVWSLVVALGFAQVWLDFILSLHFLNNPYTVANFDLTKALTLVLVTFVVGYVVGWVFAYIWNMLLKKK